MVLMYESRKILDIHIPCIAMQLYSFVSCYLLTYILIESYKFGSRQTGQKLRFHLFRQIPLVLSTFSLFITCSFYSFNIIVFNSFITLFSNSFITIFFCSIYTIFFYSFTALFFYAFITFFLFIYCNIIKIYILLYYALVNAIVFYSFITIFF